MQSVRYIHSANAEFQRLQVIKTNRNKRYRYGEFIVEGVRNINEARANKWTITSFIYADGTPLSDWAKRTVAETRTDVNLILTPELMRLLSGKTDTSELLATVKMRDEEPFSLSENPFIFMFDRPSNHGNLGTVIRSLDGFGADGLLITGHAVDLYDPETVTATMGSLFRTPVTRVTDMTALDAALERWRAAYPSLNVVGTSSHSDKPLWECDLTRPTLMILGNETDGMSRRCYEIADETATLPMSSSGSASSFNAACAATAMMYELIRQRSIKR